MSNQADLVEHGQDARDREVKWWMLLPMRLRRLTATFWHGSAPQPGDLLETRAGTVYLLDAVRPGRINPWVLDVVRLDPEDAERALLDPDAVVWGWQWNRR